MMEDSEEEEDDDNYVPPEYGDAATGEAAEDQEEPDDVPNDAARGEAAEDEEEPVPDDDDLRRVIVDARTQCESQKEKLKFDRMLEDHKKRVLSTTGVGKRKRRESGWLNPSRRVRNRNLILCKLKLMSRHR